MKETNEWYSHTTPGHTSYNKNDVALWRLANDHLVSDSRGFVIIQPDITIEEYEVWRKAETQEEANRNHAYKCLCTHNSLDTAKMALKLLRATQ